VLGGGLDGDRGWGDTNEELMLIRNHFEIIADISFVQLDSSVCSSVQLTV